MKSCSNGAFFLILRAICDRLWSGCVLLLLLFLIYNNYGWRFFMLSEGRSVACCFFWRVLDKSKSYEWVCEASCCFICCPFSSIKNM